MANGNAPIIIGSARQEHSAVFSACQVLFHTIYNEKNGLWYEVQGNYCLPCLKLPEERTAYIGVWGQRHLRHLVSQGMLLHSADKRQAEPLSCRH